MAASRGCVGVTVDLDYPDLGALGRAGTQLAGLVDEVRSLEEVNEGRVALWAFSGGALLIERWLEERPEWLRSVALSYPLLQAPGAGAIQPPRRDAAAPGLPIVLTRVGREDPDMQAGVQEFLEIAIAVGTHVEIVDVPEGRHGFDCLDYTAESRQAVVQAIEIVQRHLASRHASA